MKNTAPGAVASLVCGILSIVLCWVPIAGLVLGIIAIAKYHSAKQLESQQSEQFQAGGLAIAGLVCGIIGTVFSSFSSLCILYFSIFWLFA